MFEERLVQVIEKSAFSSKMIAARKCAGLTQGEVAEAIHKSRTAITMWERGLSIPDIKAFSAWCRLVGVTPNDFLGF